jgi:hypothetical protein
MKSNVISYTVSPFDINYLICTWHLVITFQILVYSFLECVKLVKLAMVQRVGNVEDERCFSTLAFTKSKLCNGFTTQLLIIVRMFAQHFYTLENFPYVECIE